MRLTKTAIERLSYRGDGTSRHVEWDDRLANFGVRVYPSGKKSFVISYRVKGRKRLMVLGSYPALQPDGARKLAQQKLADTTSGHDPLEEKRLYESPNRFSDLAELYEARHIPRKKSGKDDLRRIRDRILPKFKNRRIDEITRADVISLHSSIGKNAPYEANRILALLRKMFNLAKDWGMLERSADNPATRIKPFKEESRDVWVQPGQMPDLLNAVNKYPNIYVRAVLWLYLLTGIRRNELLQLKWDDVDMEQSTIRLPETKSGKPQYIPMGSMALDILSHLTREADNPFIFCGQRHGQHLVNISKPWLAIRHNAGMKGVRIHDLRRTFGSWLAQQGNTLHIISKAMHHQTTVPTQVYARVADDTLRQVFEKHDTILHDIGIEPNIA